MGLGSGHSAATALTAAFSKPRPDCTEHEERSEVRVGGKESSNALSDC